MKSQLCRMKRDSLADAIRKMPLHTCEVSVPSRRMMIPGRIPPMAGFIVSKLGSVVYWDSYNVCAWTSNVK